MSGMVLTNESKIMEKMISIYSEKEQNVDRSAVRYESCHGSKSHASLKDKNILGTNQSKDR